MDVHEVFKSRITEADAIKVNYWSFRGVWFVSTFCCCFRSTFSRSNSCKRRFTKYEKFDLAFKRLMEEHDINLMLKLNRISMLFHKLHLLPRQRKVVDFSRRYVIADADVQKAIPEEMWQKEQNIEGAMFGFDPHNDITDRRLLFDVAGIRLNDTEFRDGSSDEEVEGDDVDRGGVEEKETEHNRLLAGVRVDDADGENDG